MVPISSQAVFVCFFATAANNAAAVGWFWFFAIALIVAIAIYAHNRAWLKSPEERRKAAESAARSRWNMFHESATMEEVERMSGLVFDAFVKQNSLQKWATPKSP